MRWRYASGSPTADRHDTLRLSAMVVLGPILTAAEGPNSAPARKLYEDGVEIARRRPVAERAKWFPIYWGWWFTGHGHGRRARRGGAERSQGRRGRRGATPGQALRLGGRLLSRAS